MEGLKNVMEEAVEYQLNKVLSTMPGVCSCEKCRLDMASFALNRLHPQYVRTDTGALFQKLNNSSQQAEVEVLTAVMSAIDIISQHPKHD
ncbi:MAG: late competence development ComFB family protein [Lachnospiraceae bacterium]|nr:late competence development ComFB family protein [Lachnospiraceae bacterium]